MPERKESIEARDQKKDEIELVVVINGEPFDVQVKENQPLRIVVVDALKGSNNSGQPPENWELRDESGKLLDLAKKVADYHFADTTKLFLSLKAGIGG
jgi:hypothetical protein